MRDWALSIQAVRKRITSFAASNTSTISCCSSNVDGIAISKFSIYSFLKLLIFIPVDNSEIFVL